MNCEEGQGRNCPGCTAITIAVYRAIFTSREVWLLIALGAALAAIQMVLGAYP